MKEYGIYIRQGSGKPYMIHVFNNFESAEGKLYEMIMLEEERERPYYVDNDFFINRYNMATKLKYFCIKEREVGEWRTFSKKEHSNKEDNKIIFLQNYKNLLTK